jgi:hypothetical protein
MQTGQTETAADRHFQTQAKILHSSIQGVRVYNRMDHGTSMHHHPSQPDPTHPALLEAWKQTPSPAYASEQGGVDQDVLR